MQNLFYILLDIMLNGQLSCEYMTTGLHQNWHNVAQLLIEELDTIQKAKIGIGCIAPERRRSEDDPNFGRLSDFCTAENISKFLLY